MTAFIIYTVYSAGTKLSRDLLSEAMKDGHVESQISKILLYGAAGTGKSSFMDLILDNPPSKIRRSTSLAARPVTVFQVDMAHKEWAKLSPQQRKEVLVKATISKKAQTDQEGQSSSEEEDVGSDVEQAGEDIVPGSSEANSTEHYMASKGNTEAEGSLHPVPPFTSTGPTTQGEATNQSEQISVVSTYDDLVRLVDQFSETGESITSYHKLYLIDSGGQPQFHEILPVFLRRMTLYVFVFKLSEELDTKPMVEYYNHSGQSVGTPYQSSHTNQQLLEHCIRTLHTHRTSRNSQSKSSKIMVVGSPQRQRENRRNTSKIRIG